MYIPARTSPGGATLTKYPLDLRTAFPDTSFPPDIGPHNLTEEMVADGVVLVRQVDPPQGDFASITPGAPALIDGEWRGTWIVVERTTEQRRASVATAIDRHAKLLRDGVVALISAAEMASWPIKREQALVLQAGGTLLDTDLLVLEAAARQVTPAELAEMVLAKAQVLAGLEAMISGECGRRQDILRTLDDAEMIDAFAAGVPFAWPGFPDSGAPQ